MIDGEVLRRSQLRTICCCRGTRTPVGGAKRFVGRTLKQQLEAEGQTNRVWIHTLYRVVLRALVQHQGYMMGKHQQELRAVVMWTT